MFAADNAPIPPNSAKPTPSSHWRRAAVAALLIGAAGLLTAGCTGETQAANDSQNVSNAPTEVAPAPTQSTSVRQVVNLAELDTISGAMKVEAFDGAANGQCVRIDLGAGKDGDTPGSLSFDIDMPADKEVRIWVRAYWTGTCANSVAVQIPGFPEQVVGEDGTYMSWHWLEGPKVPLTAGTHTITLAQREDDIRIDQVLVTSSSRVTPIGIEK